MLPRCSLATRQLELCCIASTPSFLLPSFAAQLHLSTTSPLPTPSRRATSSQPKRAQQSPLSDVLAVLQAQLSAVLEPSSPLLPSSFLRTTPRRSPSPLFSSTRPFVATMRGVDAGRSVSTASVKASSPSEEPAEAEEEDAELGSVAAGRVKKKQGVQKAQRGGEGPPLKRGWDRTPLLHPPADPPPLFADLPLPTPPLSTPKSASPSSPPPPASWEADFVNPPPSRSELLRLLDRIPSQGVTESHFRAFRRLLFKMNRLDDSAPVRKLAGIGVSRQLEVPALRLLKESSRLMRQNGRPRASLAWVFEEPIAKLERRKNWNWLVTYSNAAILVDAVSETILRTRMRALYEAKRFPEIIETFALYERYGIEPDGAAYDELVAAYLLTSKLRKAQEVLAEKASRGFGTTVQTCMALLDGMWAYGGNRVMEDRVLEEEVSGKRLSTRKALRQDVRILNRIMSARAARGEVSDALEVLHQHFDLSSLPDLLAIPHTLATTPSSPSPSSPSPSASPPSPERYYWRPVPDIATFTILVGISLRRGRIDSAFSLFIQSQKLDLGLDEHLVAALVRTLLAYGDVAVAEQVVFDLPQGTAKVPWAQFTCAKYEPTAMIYEILLDGVLRQKGLQGASELLNQMVKRQRVVEVTEGMVAALVSSLTRERNDKLSTSADFVVRMQSLTNGDRKPTIRNLNAILELAWRRERFRGAWGSSRRLRNLGRSPRTLPTVATSAPTPASSEDKLPPLQPPPIPTSMSRIRRSLDHRGIQHDRETLQQILRNDQAFDSINSMWDYLQTQLVDRGMRPTYHHFTIIMRAYITLGDVVGARNVIRRAGEMGLDPHVALYSVLIGGAARLGKVEEARLAYRELREKGLKPDRQLYAALAISCLRRRDLEGVESIIAEAGRRLDPPLSPVDPVFVAILYRALVTRARFFHAQLLVRSKLRAGLVPDAAIVRSLVRTKRWLRWKSKRWRGSDWTPLMTKAVRYLWTNLSRAKKLFNRANPRTGLKELTALEAVWAVNRGTQGRKVKRGRRGGRRGVEDVQ